MNAVQNADEVVLTGPNVSFGLVSSVGARRDELHTDMFGFEVSLEFTRGLVVKAQYGWSMSETAEKRKDLSVRMHILLAVRDGISSKWQ